MRLPRHQATATRPQPEGRKAAAHLLVTCPSLCLQWWMDEATRSRIAALSNTDNMIFTVWRNTPMHLTRQQVRQAPDTWMT